MATQAEIAAYRAAVDSLSTVATARLKALLQSIDQPDPIKFRDALLATYPELMRPYMLAASEVAAQWYTELRLQAGLTSQFTPILAGAPADRQMDAVVRNSLAPLFAPVDATTGDRILTLLAGSSQRLITNQGRDTIDSTARQDPASVSWSRRTRAGACPFCEMLAGRGAVYRSAAAAGVSVSGFDGEAAGAVSHYHDHCRCVAVPTFYAIESRDGERVLVPIR